ncbi:GTPase ObgE [Patescibacteria group bacterium]|nr:GTPase ObgE [Patescibacteria group bacterium]
MALVDRITIHASAGRGGDGVVRWLHLKGKEKGGPAGGDGGKGGDVRFRAVRDLAILARYRGRGAFRAEPGEAGGNEDMHGANGESVTIDVPVGSVITRLGTGETFELIEDGAEQVALRGGRGGYGNAHFKSSTNQNPYEFRTGAAGEADAFRIELKIIADAGLIGLPNAGKSTLLNSLTAARAKVGAYAFTTLEPNLGVMYGYVLADIPGLIEGAHAGKGLGHGFLRHISRTRVLIHCVSAEEEDQLAAYKTVRSELEAYGQGLSQKPELVFITKTDTISASRLSEIQALFSQEGITTIPVTILDDASLKLASDSLVQFLTKA